MDDKNDLQLQNDEDQKQDDLFYFESDHLALKGNKDYSELLKVLFVLSAQREKSIKDYEKIQEIKKNALENPASFLELVKKDEMGIPPLQNVAQIPFINWYGYNTKIPEEELKALYNEKSNDRRESEDLGKHGNNNTHKQPWTAEEQKRLEELLVIYPPEAIELRRIKKIAAALGNRTVQQVSSRLQKYFLKLHKAGLHVPGRIPKSACIQRKNKNKHQMWKPTTFFPEYNVVVNMDETEAAPGPSTLNKSSSSSISSTNYLLPMGYQLTDSKEQPTTKSESKLQLELLKRIRVAKTKEHEMTEPFRHLTYRCDYCNEEPIIGTRWHCSSCIQDSIDFCTDCLISQLYSDEPHPLNHNFVTLPHPDDPDFQMSSDSDSESLNENFNDISDSDISGSVSSSKSKQFSSSNGNIHANSENKNGSQRNFERPTFEVDKFLNDLMYTEEPDTSSTPDVGYSYLHANLSLD